MKAKKLITVIALIAVVALSLLAVSPAAFAANNQKGSITLTLHDSDTAVSDVAFRLYFFASTTDGKNFSLISPYDEANADISDLQDSYLPVHLTYFAESRALPFTEKTTDKNGVIVFDNLDKGLYLVVPVGTDDGRCVSSPFIIAVPEYDADTKSWNYSIGAAPKINGGNEGGEKDTYITVLKKWDTDGDHPDSIKVVLLRDLHTYEIIELSEANNWYYRWNNLPSGHTWSVVEVQVPDGFTVHYETSANTVIITNSSDVSGTTKPGTTDEGTTTRPSDGEDDKDHLADTGQLNWPVPVLAISGLLAFSIGWAILNFSKKEYE